MTVRVDEYRKAWQREETLRRWDQFENESAFSLFSRSVFLMPPAPIPPWLPDIDDMSELDIIDPALRAAYAPKRPMIEGDL